MCVDLQIHVNKALSVKRKLNASAKSLTQVSLRSPLIWIELFAFGQFSVDERNILTEERMGEICRLYEIILRITSVPKKQMDKRMAEI